MRPEILFPLFAPASSLKGVGPKIAPLLAKAAGERVRDVLFLAPHSLIERTLTTVANAQEGAVQIFDLRIDAHQPPRGPGRPYRIRAADETGFIFLTWFKGYGAHLKEQHPVGTRRAVSGKVERYAVELLMGHPDYMLPIERIAEIPRQEPVYPATAGLPSRTLRRIALAALERAPELPEWQDPAWLAREQWPTWRRALERLHTPVSPMDVLPDSPHRQRLAYDELLAHQLAMAQRNAARRAEPAMRIPASARSEVMRAALPFSLTGAQIRTLSEIGGDLASGERMTRLVQGDVGPGSDHIDHGQHGDDRLAGADVALHQPGHPFA